MIDCKTRQLLQTYSYDSDDFYFCMAPMPAGRIAAGNSEGFDMLAFDMDGSELTSAGDACQPGSTVRTTLLEANAFPWYATWQCRA